MNKHNNTKQQPGKVKLLDIQRVWALIPEAKKPEAVVLLGMMILGMFLEMLGVGLVLPVITIVSKPELVQQYPLVEETFKLIGNPGKNRTNALGNGISCRYLYHQKYLPCLAGMETD